MWWLNLIIELATVSIIYVQKSYDEKATGLLFSGHSVYLDWQLSLKLRLIILNQMMFTQASFVGNSRASYFTKGLQELLNMY